MAAADPQRGPSFPWMSSVSRLLPVLQTRRWAQQMALKTELRPQARQRRSCCAGCADLEHQCGSRSRCSRCCCWDAGSFSFPPGAPSLTVWRHQAWAYYSAARTPHQYRTRRPWRYAMAMTVSGLTGAERRERGGEGALFQVCWPDLHALTTTTFHNHYSAIRIIASATAYAAFFSAQSRYHRLHASIMLLMSPASTCTCVADSPRTRDSAHRSVLALRVHRSSVRVMRWAILCICLSMPFLYSLDGGDTLRVPPGPLRP